MTVVRLRELCKGYRQYARPLDSLKEVLLRRPLHTNVWALRGVNIELERGQHLGVIGDNGAGKSTLLKLIAGTLRPSSGSLEVNGRVSAILELGTGFHPEFSGVENVRMACTMRGMPQRSVEAKLPEIIEFSELGDAVSRPVKTYSSGMYVRLAFAVATAVEPELLIVDEALSVGDQHFQKKSLDRIRQLVGAGTTLVFCSHNLYQVKSLCRRVLWLDRGRPRLLGPADEVVDAYLDSTRARDAAKPAVAPSGQAASPASPARILDASLAGEGESSRGVFAHGEQLQVRVRLGSEQLRAEDLSLAVVIKRNDEIHVYGTSTEIEGISLDPLGAGEWGKTLVLDRLELLSGEYLLYIYLLDNSGIHIYDMREGVLPFTVRHTSREVGVARLSHHWETP